MEKRDNLQVKKAKLKVHCFPGSIFVTCPFNYWQSQSPWHRGAGRSDLPPGKFNLSVETLRAGPGSWECPGKQLPCGNWERMKVSEMWCIELA